jgi:hypothetical protein
VVSITIAIGGISYCRVVQETCCYLSSSTSDGQPTGNHFQQKVSDYEETALNYVKPQLA